MKNKNGFTLIEIIGAVIIIGIISIIAVITFTGNLKGFREDYYNNISRTIEESGKEFFNDNRKYRPTDVLHAQIVPINTLVTQNYIDEIEDYKGNKCSNSSYAIVIKMGQDDYEYHACIECPEDNYSNKDDKYCDSSWSDPTTIIYGLDGGSTDEELGDSPDIYVYKGTPRNELREKLKIAVSIIKKNAEGEIIAKVDGTGIEGIPEIYPTDMDIIDTNKVGVYTVHYEYKEERIEGRVTVYENDAPRLTITKENVVATNLTGGTNTETGVYTSGEWVQKIKVSLTPGNSTSSEMSNKVSRYQWNKDGKWTDFYVGSAITDKEITTEMNEKIRFRSLDKEGHPSKETEEIEIKIDNTKPTCELDKSGDYGDNSWYITDVALSFKKNEDLLKTNNESISGVKVSNITLSTGTLSRTTNKLTETHKTDTKDVTYIGYVEDNAKNFKTCTINFKRDTKNPECTVKLPNADGNLDNGSKWYKMDTVKVEIGVHKDDTSDVRDYGLVTWNSGNKSFNHTQDTTGVTYTYQIRDNAGHMNTCTATFKKDSISPTCTVSKDHLNTTDGVTTHVSCTDTGTSGCSLSNTTGETRLKMDKTYTVYDAAGNSNNCSISVYSKQQKSIQNCTLGERCASAGCESANSCPAAGCMSYGGWSWSGSSSETGSCSSYTSETEMCTCTQLSSDDCISGGDEVCFLRNCSTRSCSAYYTSESACGCNTYYRSIGSCGCASWGSPSAWSDVNSCSSYSTNYESISCRTLYY